jgi:hypothetical protein
MQCAARPVLGMLLLSVGVSARADLVPSPLQLDFRYQAVGVTSEPGATTLTNSGNQALTITAVSAATGVYARAGGTCGAAPFTIAVNASCTIEHTFTPTSVQLFYQTIVVTLAGGSTVNFGLAGEGAQGFLEFTPSRLYFPSVPVGSSSNEVTASLANPRPVPLYVTQAGPLPSVNPFVRTGGTCPQPPFVLGAYGGNCTLTYVFVPTAVGHTSMDLGIIATAGTFSLSFNGEGLPEVPLFHNGFEMPAPAPVQ